MPEIVSVVVPVFNGAETLEDCLRALSSQSLPRSDYEVIVVDAGSTDSTVSVAERYNVRVLRKGPRRLCTGAARNAGISESTAKWVAFTDADCVPSRTWLQNLLTAVGRDDSSLGAAGKTTGFMSQTPAARFVDLTGGLDAQTYLAHPKFPFAPGANVMYRRTALSEVGGFDERFETYESCDLHYRLIKSWRGPFFYEPRALVLHKHRRTWRKYWRQQLRYGRGYGQFLVKHMDGAAWSWKNELNSWGKIAQLSFLALYPRMTEKGLVSRGNFIKHTAQKLGFLATYWNIRERGRWRDNA